jgi:hypothetical protein
MVIQVEDWEDSYPVSIQCLVCKWWVKFALSRLKEVKDEECFVCDVCEASRASWDGFQEG